MARSSLQEVMVYLPIGQFVQPQPTGSQMSLACMLTLRPLWPIACCLLSLLLL
jgi:hypothetical protein